MKIVFATNNQHKLDEIREILGNQYEVVSLHDIGCTEDIPETGDTLEKNAWQKARYIFEKYHLSCFADDTGLEVEALNGAPGVHSARYAEGTDHDSEEQFEGIVNGHIAYEKSGTKGFGYDPIFVPDGYELSFAELGMEIKNHISHRARAVQKLADYLKRL